MRTHRASPTATAGWAATIILTTTFTALIVSSAHAAAGSDHLSLGERLNPGQSISHVTTNNSRVELVMQTDGNLVLYNDGLAGSGRRVCWAANTKSNGYQAIYQTDGNFVVYNRAGKPTWASNTQRDGGTTTNINSYGQLWAGNKDISGYCE